jgi:hypothetical protein
MISELCKELLKHTVSFGNGLYRILMIPSTTPKWYIMNTWGGHLQIPPKHNMALECSTAWGKNLALAGKIKFIPVSI